jgi:hypothetical protein
VPNVLPLLNKFSDDFLSGNRSADFQPNSITGSHIDSECQKRTACSFEFNEAGKLGHKTGSRPEAKGKAVYDGLSLGCGGCKSSHQTYTLFELRIVE